MKAGEQVYYEGLRRKLSVMVLWTLLMTIRYKGTFNRIFEN